MYGALRIQTGDGLKKLEQYGITLEAGMTLVVNTTNTDKQIDLRLPGTKANTATETKVLSAGDLPLIYLGKTPKATGNFVLSAMARCCGRRA